MNIRKTNNIIIRKRVIRIVIDRLIKRKRIKTKTIRKTIIIIRTTIRIIIIIIIIRLMGLEIMNN